MRRKTTRQRKRTDVRHLPVHDGVSRVSGKAWGVVRQKWSKNVRMMIGG